MNLTRCESHQHYPPMTDMAGARHWAARMRSLSIPGALADFLTYRQSSPCCPAGAYAFYLAHAALREFLAGDGPAWKPSPAVPNPVTDTVNAVASVGARFPDLLARQCEAMPYLTNHPCRASYMLAAGVRTATQGE